MSSVEDLSFVSDPYYVVKILSRTPLSAGYPNRGDLAGEKAMLVVTFVDSIDGTPFSSFPEDLSITQECLDDVCGCDQATLSARVRDRGRMNIRASQRGGDSNTIDLMADRLEDALNDPTLTLKFEDDPVIDQAFKSDSRPAHTVGFCMSS